MNSDSDSDDSMMNLNPFQPIQRKRTEDRNISRGFNIMEEALNHAGMMNETEKRIAQLKHENITKHRNGADAMDEEEIMANVQKSIADNKEKRNKVSEGKEIERKRQEANAGLYLDVENHLPHKTCVAWGKAFDIELSSTLGSRNTIHYDPQRTTTCLLVRATKTKASGNGSKNGGFAKEHVRQLKELLRQLISPRTKLLQTAWIQPLRKAMASVYKMEGQQYQDLQVFLEQHYLERLQGRHDLPAEQVPSQLLQWLWRVACSYADNDNQLRNGAMSALQGLLRLNASEWKRQQLAAPREQKIDVVDKKDADKHNNINSTNNHTENEETDDSNDETLRDNDGDDDEDDRRQPFLCLSEMALQLHGWLPLASSLSRDAISAVRAATSQSYQESKLSNKRAAVTQTSSGSANTNSFSSTATTTVSNDVAANANNKDEAQAEKNDDVDIDTLCKPVNPKGLECCLLLWNCVLEKELVSAATRTSTFTNDEKSKRDQRRDEDGARNATLCLVLLSQLGLDESVHSPKR